MARSRTTKTSTTKTQAKSARERAEIPATERVTSARVPGGGAGEQASASSSSKAHPARGGRGSAKPGASAPSKLASRLPSIAHDVAPPADEATGSKQARVIALLRRGDGATTAELMAATGWLAHSVRGVISGVLKRKLGLAVQSQVEPDRGRVYRIGRDAAAAPIASARRPPHAREPRAIAAAPGDAG